jgi:8-oxo-dGTP pyrophosphatase MutT (NUDIX family)
VSTDYKARIREAILADLPDHNTLYNAPGQIGDGRLDGGFVGRPRLNGNRALKLAAVLVPVVDYENEPKILLTRRADHLAQHSGQVAFPGGKVEAEDGGPVSAALREAQEEIGLSAEYVDVAGFLSTYETGSGFRILPVVGFVRPGFQLEIDHNEVAETFEVPLELMINEANYNRHEIEWEGRMEAYYAVEYEGYNIWGATAGMLRNLSRRMQT